MMVKKNPFRKYRHKYAERLLMSVAIALALFTYTLSVYVYKLPLIFKEWALELIITSILAGLISLFMGFAIMYYAIHAVYYWKLERLYERNPRLAVKIFMLNYTSPEAKAVRKVLRFLGLS
jgi:uncharacterized membrane protein